MKIKLLKPIIVLGAVTTALASLSACGCSTSTSTTLDQFYKYVDESGNEMM
ncbi:MAG: hypothetical protein MJ201_01310 [Mycoplasmoidaceae bacterium]|nr:hypothetical protein [Mycoplasmoidaceae bacterium]